MTPELFISDLLASLADIRTALWMGVVAQASVAVAVLILAWRVK